MSAVLAAVRFRAMTYDDLAIIMNIERAAYAFPWTEPIIRDCIRVGYLCQVLEQRGRISAYGIISLGAGEGHVLNLCVQPLLQHCGLGRQMLNHLLDLAHSRQVETLFLEVRPSNKQALRLYQAAGFCEVGLRPNYYPNGKKREDAVVMAKAITS